MVSNKPEKVLVNIITESILRQCLLHLPLHAFWIYNEPFKNNTHHLLYFTLTP